MAERIITGKTGEAHVTSLDERVLNGSLLGRNTLYKLPWGSNFDISITGNFTAKVGTGIGVFQGIEFMIEDPIELTFESLGPSVYRTDLIIVEYKKDSVSGLESVEVKVKTGDASTVGNPPAPSLIQQNIWDGDGTIYQQTIATITMEDSKIFGYMPSGVIVTDGFSSHITNKNNPHNVTKSQVGLDKVKSVKSALTATKLKYPFTLSFTGDLKGSTKIDGYDNVELNAEFKGGQLMPFTYNTWTENNINTRDKFYELIPNWYNKQGDVIPSRSVISHGYAFLYTSGNFCKVELRIQPKFSDAENPQVVDLLSFSKLDFNLEALHPIVMDYSTTMSSSKLPLYNARAHLEYVYYCTLNYPKKGGKMFSRKEIPIALIAKEFDSYGNILSSQLVSDGTSFVSSFSIKNEWEPAIIAAKNGVIAPEWLFIELTFPCKPIGGSDNEALSYISIVGETPKVISEVKE